jgi:hypothetical protein
MSPQRSAVSGKPLKLATGAPMKDCCCAGSPVDCGSCSPPLDEMYDITLAGFTGTWTPLNGIWTVVWTSGCTWYGEFDALGGSGIDLQVWLVWRNSSPNAWEVTFQVGYWCYRSYRKEASDPCTVRPPGGSYPYFATSGDCDTDRAKDVTVSVA